MKCRFARTCNECTCEMQTSNAADFLKRRKYVKNKSEPLIQFGSAMTSVHMIRSTSEMESERIRNMSCERNGSEFGFERLGETRWVGVYQNVGIICVIVELWMGSCMCGYICVHVRAIPKFFFVSYLSSNDPNYEKSV